MNSNITINIRNLDEVKAKFEEMLNQVKEQYIDKGTSNDIIQSNLENIYINVVVLRKCEISEARSGFSDLELYRNLCNTYFCSISVFINTSDDKDSKSRKLALGNILENLEQELKEIYKLISKVATFFELKRNGKYIFVEEYNNLQVTMVNMIDIRNKVKNKYMSC